MFLVAENINPDPFWRMALLGYGHKFELNGTGEQLEGFSLLFTILIIYLSPEEKSIEMCSNYSKVAYSKGIPILEPFHLRPQLFLR